MAVRQASIPVYKETPIVLTANATFTLHRTCELVAVIEMSGAAEMSINDADFSTIRGGIIFKMPDDGTDNAQKITKLTFRETAGAGCNMIIATADGQVYDNRASFAGNLPVINAAAPNDSLQVDLLAGDPGVLAIIAALQASDLLRPRYTPLIGTYSARTGEGAEQTIVSAVANTDGILVHRAVSLHVAGGAEQAYFAAGPNQPFCGLGVIGTLVYSDQVNDIFIPAGVGLFSRHGAGASQGHIWYTVL